MIHALRRVFRLPKAIGPAALDEPTPAWLIVCALVIGVGIGFLAPVTEQPGIDGALVLAGVIAYPPDSAMSQYFFNSWTIINQLGALLLRAGLEQSHLNAFFSIVPRAVLIAAYAMIIHGFSRRPLFSLIAAPLCFLSYFSNPVDELFASPDYPLPGFYALWAHCGTIWVIACVAARRDALAGFFSILLIAVHPFIGLYMVAILATAYSAARVLSGFALGDVLRGMAFGAALATVSLAAFLLMRPPFSGDLDMAAYRAYMRFWDFHRNQPMTPSNALRIGAAAVVAVATLMAFMRSCPPRLFAPMLASAVVLLAVIASTIVYYALHLVPGLLPQLLIDVMPGRLLNVHAYLALPLAVGLMAYVVNRLPSSGVVRIPRWLGDRAARLTSRFAPGGHQALDVNAIDRKTIMLGILLVIVTMMVPARKLGRAVPTLASQQTNVATPPAETQTFWRQAKAAVMNGQVLTSPSATWPSLYHGHLAAALNITSFDFVPYLPYTAGPVAHIIQAGYGVPFFNPPPELRNTALLPDEAVKVNWTKRTPAEWLEVSRDLGVVGVVVPKDWAIKLPAVVTGERFTLYTIPQGIRP
jgi:hypothetical protein